MPQPHPLTGLITRLREARATQLTLEATALYTTARHLYETADPTDERRRIAHRLAARAEHLTARSHLWMPPRPERNP
ncbi:hypothetical protein ABTX35_01545 [Streptomyces sp. NPDC096080]|uniref:hypothetical protein n=1 Tax=Streptomyces sp. NPDC096080 TaxID=3156693 RepID=UPI0033188742